MAINKAQILHSMQSIPYKGMTDIIRIPRIADDLTFRIHAERLRLAAKCSYIGYRIAGGWY